MNLISKKLLCALLAVVIAVSAFGGVVFSAAELDTDNDQTAAIAPEGVDPPAEGGEELPTEVQQPTEAPPTVGKVTNLVRTSKLTDACTLEWNAVPGAAGYYVYMCNADVSDVYEKVATVKATTVTIKNLLQGTQYHFRVSAYINHNGEIIEGPKTTKKTATQLSKIAGLDKWRASNVIELRWSKNAKATGYRVYRSESGGAEKLYKTITGNSNTTFVDSKIKQGRIYKYRVQSIRSLYETYYTGEFSAMTVMAGLCGPNYSIASRCQRVNLTWKANPYATQYDIYYSTSPDNSTFTKLYTTKRLYYNTSKLTNGKTYYFRVRPVYKGSITLNGTSQKKSVKVTASAYGKSTGKTYIEISISQQHLWAYKNGSQIVSTDVVTGNYGSADTPKGYYSVRSKSRGVTLRGAGYASYVEYWMAFIGSSYGIHDASWRSSFGYPIYKGNGSHGCVNTPRSKVVTLYNNIPVGTPVIIY